MKLLLSKMVCEGWNFFILYEEGKFENPIRIFSTDEMDYIVQQYNFLEHFTPPPISED